MTTKCAYSVNLHNLLSGRKLCTCRNLIENNISCAESHKGTIDDILEIQVFLVCLAFSESSAKYSLCRPYSSDFFCNAASFSKVSSKFCNSWMNALMNNVCTICRGTPRSSSKQACRKYAQSPLFSLVPQ